MATRVDTLVTKYQLDDNYSAKLHRIARATSGLTAAMWKANWGIRAIVMPFMMLGRALLWVGGILGVMVIGSLIALGKASFTAAMDMETLELQLRAILGSADRATAAMTELMEVAKLPGINLRGAIQGFTQLMAIVGIQAPFAVRVLKEFGNALAMAGGTQEEFGRLLINLRQILAFGRLTGREFREITFIIPQFVGAMERAFGTASTEKLQKMGLTARQVVEGVLVEFGKFPRMTTGLRNAWENLGDVWFRVLAGVGTAFKTHLEPVLLKLTESLLTLVEGGIIDNVFSKLADAFGNIDIVTPIIKGISWVLTLIERIPQVLGRIGGWMKEQFRSLGQTIATVGTLLAFLAAASILRGIFMLISAFVQLAISIAAATAGLTMFQTILSWGAALGVVAIAVTGAVKLFEYLQSLIPTAGDVGGMARGLGIDVRGLQTRQQEIFGGIMGTPEEAGTGKVVADQMKDLADAVRGNTEVQTSILDRSRKGAKDILGAGFAGLFPGREALWEKIWFLVNPSAWYKKFQQPAGPEVEATMERDLYERDTRARAKLRGTLKEDEAYRKSVQEAAEESRRQQRQAAAGIRPMHSQLERIARATEKTSQLLSQDFARYIFGGGDLGRLGVTPVEKRGIRTGTLRIKIDGAEGDPLMMAFQNIIQKVIYQAQRQGAI